MLGDLTVKKRKIGKRNLYLTDNWLTWNEKKNCAADITIICVTDVQKTF